MKYVKWVTRPSSLERVMPLIEYFYKKGLKRFISIPEGRINATYYMEEESYFRILRIILEEALSNPKKHIEDYEKLKEKILTSAIKLSQKAKKYSGKELLEEFNKYYGAKCDDYGPYILMPFALEEFTEKEVEKVFPDKFSLISSPSTINETQKMQLALFKESIEKVTEEFSWLNIYSLYEEPFTEEHFNKLKSELTKKEVEEIIQQIKNNKREFNDFIKKVKDEELRNKCVLLNEYAFIRTDRIDAWKKASYIASNFYQKLADESPEKGWTLYETINLTGDEIREILSEKKYPKLREIQLRSNKQGIFSYENGIWEFITDKKEIDKIKQELRGEIKNDKQLTGMKANKGKAIGTARIILSRADLNKIKQDDIMVAIVTDPVYTPYMKKCKAIVTNEGGITSHSAITSRELGIPCIIGTKHATEVFKDGDKIEVDGNTGIVRLM